MQSYTSRTGLDVGLGVKLKFTAYVVDLGDGYACFLPMHSKKKESQESTLITKCTLSDVTSKLVDYLIIVTEIIIPIMVEMT